MNENKNVNRFLDFKYFFFKSKYELEIKVLLIYFISSIIQHTYKRTAMRNTIFFIFLFLNIFIMIISFKFKVIFINGYNTS